MNRGMFPSLAVSVIIACTAWMLGVGFVLLTTPREQTSAQITPVEPPATSVVAPTKEDRKVDYPSRHFVRPQIKPKPVVTKPKPVVKSKPKVVKKTVPAKKPVVKHKPKKDRQLTMSAVAKCIAHYESGGNPKAENPHSTASGLFQFIDGTWNNFKGYARAKYAPVSVQLQKFYIVWDGGRGASNWVTAHKCGY